MQDLSPASLNEISFGILPHCMLSVAFGYYTAWCRYHFIQSVLGILMTNQTQLVEMMKFLECHGKRAILPSELFALRKANLQTGNLSGETFQQKATMCFWPCEMTTDKRVLLLNHISSVTCSIMVRQEYLGRHLEIFT